MKKFLKFGAVLTALMLGLACFVGCGEENDGDSRSVVAEYKEKNHYSSSYIFYSDDTYEVKTGIVVHEKGTYSGNPTTMGKVTLIQPSELDDTGNYLPGKKNYALYIDKMDNGLYIRFEDDDDYSYIKI